MLVVLRFLVIWFFVEVFKGALTRSCSNHVGLMWSSLFWCLCSVWCCKRGFVLVCRICEWHVLGGLLCGWFWWFVDKVYLRWMGFWSMTILFLKSGALVADCMGTCMLFSGYLLMCLSNRPQVSVVYRLINHAGCWKNTRRICKSRAAGKWFTNSSAREISMGLPAQ